MSAPLFSTKTKIHFVGIGGIGMSGLAEVLVNLGYPVSGSDIKTNQAARRLASMGVEFREGHRGEQVEGADVVVVSSAVRPEISCGPTASNRASSVPVSTFAMSVNRTS